MSKKTARSRKLTTTLAAVGLALIGSAALVIVGDDLTTIALMLAGVAGLALLRARPILHDTALSITERRGYREDEHEPAKRPLHVVREAA